MSSNGFWDCGNALRVMRPILSGTAITAADHLCELALAVNQRNGDAVYLGLNLDFLFKHCRRFIVNGIADNGAMFFVKRVVPRGNGALHARDFLFCVRSCDHSGQL